MKKTAVDWFALKVMYLKMNPKEVFEFIGWLEEAKEMEKEQMLECYENVFFTDSGSELKFEEYYNETYEKK
jgi:hypothetical protein